VQDQLEKQLVDWLRQHGKARTNLAAALVIVDKLTQKCPLSSDDLFTETGALKGGRSSSFRRVCKRHGLGIFLRDGTTTRSSGYWRDLADRLNWGRGLARLTADERSAVLDRLLQIVKEKLAEWFKRQHLKITCDRQSSPLAWIEEILAVARDRSQGRVEQHLVGAKLEIRLPRAEIGRDSATAGDAQTGRPGDFRTGRSAYHVTAAPSSSVITKCKENIQEGLHPVLLVPRAKLERAKGLAQDQDLETQVSVLAIEDFVAHNIVEVAEDTGDDFMDVLRRIVSVYNERIQEAEVDKSLRIDLR